MKAMRHVFTVLVSSAVLLSAGGAAAPIEDHVKCYKVKDPLKRRTLNTPRNLPRLDLVGTQFGSESCRIVGGFRLMCVPVEKTVTQSIERKFSPPGGSYAEFTPSSLAAPPAPGDRMCYKIKCDQKFPDPPNHDEEVTGQFGTRTLTKLKPYLVCSPAVKGPDPTVKGFRGFPATGQAMTYGTGDDGDVQAGAPLSYADNGDGTITDLNTGLMWEKKDDNDAGSVHDMDNTYTWSASGTAYDGTVVTDFLDKLNIRCDDDEVTPCATDADCVGAADTYASNDLCGHAGYRDWRLANVKELQSIVDYDTFSPSVDPAFNTACAASCTVTSSPGPECSCTASSYYWSSTTYAQGTGYAWGVYFYDGNVSYSNSSYGNYARAVRGGSWSALEAAGAGATPLLPQ